MAINSNSVSGDKDPLRSLCSSKTSNLSSCRLIKINFAGKDSCSSSRAYGPNTIKDTKSPYFTNDKVQFLNRVTAKKVSTKKPCEFVSSFPLAASVYKANSDEFKLKKGSSHKVKKSVLTLPNEPVPLPKTYTVSDLNDSEYFNAATDSRANKPKKRRTVKRIKKSRVKEPTMEFCDRDARYCSQLNIDLDCSSSEIVNFTGDGERTSKMSYQSNNLENAGNYSDDMWAVLNNINKFQFSPSPPESHQSMIPLRKRRPIIRKNNNGNDTHFIKTCHTEEFAYISSYEVDSKTRVSCSPSSSFDRITVIDKQSEQGEIMHQFSRSIFGTNLKLRKKIKGNIQDNQPRERNKRRLKHSNKKESNAKMKTNTFQALENNMVNTFSLEERQNVAINHRHDQTLPEFFCETSCLFKPIENCSDISSIKENDEVSNHQANDLQKGGRSSEIYKCNVNRIKNPNTKVKSTKPLGDSEKQLNGISRVVLSRGKEISPKLAEPQRKPRLALTLINTNIPKLSRFDIKRCLVNQKFPIVILGKDQLTNRGIYVTNVDPPQFEGLDKQIWPFMLEWFDNKRFENLQDIPKKDAIKSKNSKLKNRVNHRDDMSINVNLLTNQSLKKVEYKKKRINTVPTTNNRIQLATEVSSNVVQKSKTLSHLRNKMFHFLHKQPISHKLHENDWSNDRQIEKVLNDKQVGTNDTIKKYEELNNRCNLISAPSKEASDKSAENRIVPKSYSAVTYPWAKGKWASDFIENIIKKIRSGVYYGVERKENKQRLHGTEVFTQTETNTSKNAYCQNGSDFDFESNSIFQEDDPLRNIPGFDNSLNTLQIETISTNKIAVKHCVTNVVVHFDIQLLGEAKNMTPAKKPMVCVPVDGQNNNEKVFKCNITIINAMLPAELCSILPTMMRNILDSESKLSLQAANMENVHCNKCTNIPVFTEVKSPRLTIHSILSGYAISNKIRQFLNGRFRSSLLNNTHNNIRAGLHYPTETMDSPIILFPKINTQILGHTNEVSVHLRIIVSMRNMLTEKTNEEINRTHTRSYCTDLQLYEPKKFSIVPYLGSFKISDFVKQNFEKLAVKWLNKFEMESNTLTYHNINIFISTPSLSSQGEKHNVLSLPLDGNEYGVISIFNALKKNNAFDCEYTVHLNTTDSNKEETEGNARILTDESKFRRKKGNPIKVLHKKSYVRFYRKCKSMSSISSYKCTPLSRVTNLEEFCQVLGSNLFCNVLNGCLEKRILGSIEEMKNWTTEISPKQALLILLLTNKKDTSNLIRFRPVLLQGIAVNRITKADELDTEIEVIERENFKICQCEGISYLPASTKNQDSLLEELYWIAKTTASDYQKTFDESSEKLLKSLLEKRKKLNPSYLRVMARYVGLGLLAPTKL